MIAAARPRSGNAGSARGAASQIAEAITAARSCGASGEIVVRADSAFYIKTDHWKLVAHALWDRGLDLGQVAAIDGVAASGGGPVSLELRQLVNAVLHTPLPAKAPPGPPVRP